MSRSCQSATFSRPTSALPRTSRASPQIRSATIGLRLCGIADEPFCPRANGSSTSRTSVRARWRISSGEAIERGREERERREELRVAVALEDLGRRRRRLEPERLACDALDLGRRRRVRADRARELARPAGPRPRVLDAGARSRSSSNAQPASLSPNVVGSACTPCVRPIVTVSRCSSRALDDGGERARRCPSARGARLLDRERERGVEHVRGRQAVVEPPAVRAEPLGRRRRRRRRRRGSSFARSRPPARVSARARSRTDRGAALGGDDPDLRPGSSAASSTASHRSSFASSDQTRAMAGRE